jgi:hypothetical protein
MLGRQIFEQRMSDRLGAAGDCQEFRVRAMG